MIKKLQHYLGYFLLSWLLTGCGGFNSLNAHYALTEPMLNDYLQQHLKPQSLKLSSLLEAKVSFSQLESRIGRDQPDRIGLKGKVNLGLFSLVGSQSADISVNLSARPELDTKHNAIYLKDLTLVSYDLSSNLGSVKDLTLFMPYLNNTLQYLFNNQPVYVLDPTNSAMENLVSKVASGIEVKKGKIELTFLPR